uniref:Protein kinase domain-containing protein n=1 Tax=Glossina palpalis gambiensis TaxID=67801 RepID=A0A1B0C602_9MUSC
MGSRCVGKTMSSGIIQNEHCNGDSLQSLLQERSLVESELKLLLLHVAEGQRYIHSNDLVHRDLKSEIIFFTKMPSGHKSPMAPSSPRQPDPNSMDDSTLLLPVLSAAQSRKT